MSLHRASIGLVGIFLATGGTTQQPRPRAERLELTFGVYTSDKATTMYRMFTPILERMQELVEERLRRPVNIQLRIHGSYAKALAAFVGGKVDFVRFGPASYVLAKARNPHVELLAAELKKGKRHFNGMIVVRRDSAIRKVTDLRGCRFAFGDRNSTIGRYLAQDRLLAAGIHAKDLAGYDYLGAHDRVFRAVELGDYAAGSLKESTFKKLNKKKRLRVLATFENVTKPWIARAGLDPRVRKALRDALLHLKAPDALKNLKVDGFVAAADEDFEPTRKSMRRAQEFARPRAAPQK